jgi:hypothetical protein
MALTITTWNSQGDPTTDSDKSQVLANVWKKADILLLQECGNLKNINGVIDGIVAGDYGQQAGSFNVRLRCSTALLAKYQAKFETKYLTSSTGRSAIIAFFEGNLAVATLHAVSGGIGGTDVANLVKDFQTQKASPPTGSSRNKNHNGMVRPHVA